MTRPTAHGRLPSPGARPGAHRRCSRQWPTLASASAAGVDPSASLADHLCPHTPAASPSPPAPRSPSASSSPTPTEQTSDGTPCIDGSSNEPAPRPSGSVSRRPRDPPDGGDWISIPPQGGPRREGIGVQSPHHYREFERIRGSPLIETDCEIAAMPSRVEHPLSNRFSIFLRSNRPFSVAWKLRRRRSEASSALQGSQP